MTDEATLKSQGVSVLRSAPSRPQAQYWQLGQFPSAQARVQGRFDVSLEADGPALLGGSSAHRHVVISFQNSKNYLGFDRIAKL